MTQTRTMGGALGCAACCVWIATAVLGCTAETSGEIAEDTFAPNGVASDDSNLGEVSQTLEQFVDRPAVAAVGVGATESNNIVQMWVFACKSNNTLWRRVKPSWTSSWDPWTQVSSTPCSGVPTAGAWDTSLYDTVEVFYRSTEGKLIEIYYRADGTVAEVDLSARLGLGTINGNPVIADMGGGANPALAVAVRDASNRLKTLSWRGSTGWVIQSAVNAAGSQIHADGLLTAIYTPQLTYLSSSLNGTYRVLSRTKWADPYVGINATIPSSRGVLTFTAPTPDTALVINRDGADRVTKSAIVAGQAWNFTLANDTDVKATPYMGYSNSYAGARGLGHDRGIGCRLVAGECEVTTLWGLNDTQTVTYVYVGSDLNSAGTRAVNPGSRMDDYVFFAGANMRLQWANLWSETQFNGAFEDLGLTVLVP
jgi:hypothetical protein